MNGSGADVDQDQNAPPASQGFSLLVIGYCAVAAVLSLRLCTGAGLALRLRSQAERVVLDFHSRLDVRTSSRISSPVTVASSVLLPCRYSRWDEATLRTVLAHERAHVRQGDFYVHLLAGIHCAVFWFNPFSWWLRGQLSDLGEALSDGAAVEHAESRACYAETLLAFAVRAHSPLAGIAMARASNLAPRIERLLNDGDFERAFAKRRRLPWVAAAVVSLAMAASTSMTRLHAESTSGATDGDQEGVIAIRAGGTRVTINSMASAPPQIGDYIYYRQDGKPYVVQDPQIIAQTQALLGPLQDLERQQKELRNQQRQLGAREHLLAAQHREVKVDSPTLKHQMDEIRKSMQQMNLGQGSARLDQKSLAELESHLAEIQSRVGALQAEIGRQEESFGERQGELGEQQGQLGEQEARLAEQSRKIVGDVRRQMKPIIEQAIRDGKAKPAAP